MSVHFTPAQLQRLSRAAQALRSLSRQRAVKNTVRLRDAAAPEIFGTPRKV